ncbi:short-chain dehydrogenase [Thiosulfatimonas sediminis]|uniref:Short-chain dehydrogenase n=1 Tax=Thiosulfatimonas sediminis TaxID=2675054 RepID=A0A6F8PXC2_9GAMM|nr:SDR family NAD(P)-dependent oxidoreductase [Thiosulfatimonas sediminis]BBP46793.1 short-chain dehydrogenase [Thiosulfatimonas sediminis]
MQPTSTTSQRIWLLGASQGIGLALTQRLLQHGYRVIASARNATKNADLLSLQQRYPQQLIQLDCDIQDADLTSACQQAWHAFEGLDIWFYNVGAYQPMRSDAWDLATFNLMLQSNYLGAVKAMIPLQQLQQQQQHQNPMRWLWNISLSADFGLPYGGGYSAPKAALLNLAESLQPELAQQQISLQVINHGFVKTRLTAKNDFAMPGLMSPEQAADKIFAFLQKPAKRFELRFPFGLSLLLASLKRLPKGWSQAITKKML